MPVKEKLVAGPRWLPGTTTDCHNSPFGTERNDEITLAKVAIKKKLLVLYSLHCFNQDVLAV
jgi:hypothetical protein